MSLRLGILGGMFDPVHCGHVAVAREARDALQLDQVHLVPCHLPAHRQQASASGAHRLAMVRLALAGEPGLIADDRELRSPGVSYTIDTLNSFRSEFPAATLVCIMGWDSFAGLTGWHQWESLLELSHLCVATRPSDEQSGGIKGRRHASGSSLAQPLDRLLAERQVFDLASLYTKRAGHVFLLNDLALPHSSTAVRANLVADEPEITAIAEPVLQYIRQHQLYF